MAKKLVKGNTAVVIGALYAGSDCYFGYPITPASEVLHEASKYYPKLGRKFVQAESEEASINMCYGAASTGHRVFTASSGPGISLMQEGISYMAGAELPCVIVDIMRAGPGLGNIGPEQGDYNQVVKGGGHGNYKPIVLAPNSVQEMCDLTMLAFDLADKYRTPVYVLTDGMIGQMMEKLELPEPRPRRMPPAWSLDRDVSADNWISSIYMDPVDLEETNRRLNRKYDEIRAKEQLCEEFMMDDAEYAFVAYGIASRMARSAVDVLRQQGVKIGLVRPLTLFPFPENALRKAVRNGVKQFISVEMSNGQMIDDVRLAIECARPVSLVNRMGGNVPTVEEIVNRTMEAIKGGK